jgi:hypothetical protein
MTKRLEEAWEKISDESALSPKAQEYLRTFFFCGACAILHELNQASKGGDVEDFLRVRDELFAEALQFQKDAPNIKME